MLRWVSMAPFETPVVPPVYCRKARSSWVISTFFSSAPAPRLSAVFSACAFGKSCAAPAFHVFDDEIDDGALGEAEQVAHLVSTTCLTGVFASTSSSVAAKFSMMTMTSARSPSADAQARAGCRVDCS